MKKLILTILVISALSASAQKKLKAKLLRVNSKDTIEATIKVSVNMFDKKLLDERSFLRKIIVINQNGKEKIKSSEVRYLTFTDFFEKKREFISLDELSRKHGLINVGSHRYPLIEEVYLDNLSWYKSYSSHGYDGSKIILNHFVLDGELIFINSLINVKKKFKKLTKKFPQLESKIEEGITSDADILELVKKYNSLANK